MPLMKARKGSSKKARRGVAGRNISEFHKGKTYARTRRKYGVKRARAQAIAVGLKTAGLSRKRKKK